MGITNTPILLLEKPDYLEPRWDLPSNRNLTELDRMSERLPKTIKSLATSANLVDIFRYDTTKDSDGGIWRFRCQNKSWYNESLNTATRGATREFPAIALIVAETTKVTIYDATVVGCPMWMVFNVSSPSILYTPSTTAISAINGSMAVCGSTYGVVEVSFLKDSAFHFWDSGVYTGYYKGNIALRNAGLDYYQNNSSRGFLVNVLVNDVAMCVIPNAPIDPLTGLPVPTIAVATAGGISIIDGYAGGGTVVDQVLSSIAALYCSIIDNRLSWGYSNAFFQAPLSAYLADYSNASVGAHETNYGGKFYNNQGIGNYSIPPTITSTGAVKCAVSGKAFGSTNGLTLLSEDTTTPANGMVAHVTKDYNTGWMKGDIRRALICEAEGTTETLTGGTLTDRSPKASTFIVNGTLQRTPVAAGAELQQIGPFSTSNFLSQAYSADLDFGVGDFYIAGWLNILSVLSDKTILSRGSYSGSYSGAAIILDMIPSGGIRLTVTDDGFSSYDIFTDSSAIAVSAWRFIVAQRVVNNIELWKDVIRVVNSALVNTTASLSNATATTRVGVTSAGTSYFNGSLSLLRMGAGSLSQAQIEKMYKDELPLFQPGGKCTLQGTSNAVNCLDYDALSDTLTAGTQAGATSFNKLIAFQETFVGASAVIKSIAKAQGMSAAATSTEALVNIPEMVVRGELEAIRGKASERMFGDLSKGNYSKFNEVTGHLKFFGEATGFEDDNMDPLSLTGTGTAPAEISFSTSGIKIASFVNGATDGVSGHKEIPHCAKLAAVIQFHCHWHPTTVNTGVCRFGLEYFFTQTGVAPTFPAVIYVEQAGGGVAWAKLNAYFANITPPNELGCQLHFRFFRDGGHANDTFTGDAAVSTVGYHYEANDIGSEGLTTK